MHERPGEIAKLVPLGGARGQRVPTLRTTRRTGRRVVCAFIRRNGSSALLW
ncbi:hypothetical protein BN2497_1547 [Janthinobacterium sp. CG23_2]|nr:hypothetical protein BN2497_1547 [Janthinobacterium sp. CG23_2]CUU27171.1 hypothetical protein BN3177_1547 [Janthinobacterium sp. CG23_2]